MKGHPLWLWIGAGLDLLLLVPGFYMAIGAVEIAREMHWAGFADGVAFLFIAFPVFCMACPAAAFGARRKAPVGKGRHHGAVLLGAPFVYAAFLVFFVVKA